METQHMNEFRISATKIAKKLNISMTRASEDLIEFAERDIDKIKEFRKAIFVLNTRTKVVELISTKQHIDINGYDMSNNKALYLTNDDYYYELVGLGKNEQLALF